MDFVKLKELPRFWSSVNADGDIKHLKSFKKRVEESCGIESDINAMAFSPSSESSELAVACGTKVQVYEIGFASVSESASWSKHKNVVHCLSYRKDGKLLVAGDGDGSANIYDVGVSKSIIRRLRGHDGAIYAAAFCPDNTRVVTAGKDQTVKVWDVPTGQVVMNLQGHSDSVRSLLTLGDDLIISGGSDGKIIKWEQGAVSCVAAHGQPIEKLALFGGLFFSIGGGVCRLWDVRTMAEVKQEMQVKHSKPVTCAAVSKCGDFLATSSFDMTLKITRISSWEVLVSFSADSAITAMAWKGEDLVMGEEKGRWILRQKRREEEGSKNIAVALESERYYKTEVIKGPPSSSRSAKKESNPDFLLRKFEYRKLVDFVVESNPASALGLAVFDELIQRGGLLAAVRDRSCEELINITEWCTRFLAIDPRCSIKIVSQVVEAVVETNKRTLAEASPLLMKAVERLNSKISLEMSLQFKAAALAGLLESLVL